MVQVCPGTVDSPNMGKMDDTDGTVTDPMLDVETTRYLVPSQKPGDAMYEAFWNLAGPCPDGPDERYWDWAYGTDWFI